MLKLIHQNLQAFWAKLEPSPNNEYGAATKTIERLIAEKNKMDINRRFL